jgi:PHD/YefM family antitoxin component YafN of YafNO toxin-antitoxin module
MQYVSSTDVRNYLSKAMEMALREPVMVQKQGRDMAVILSAQDFARITRDNIEDFLAFSESVGLKAQKKGLTPAKLKKLLED